MQVVNLNEYRVKSDKTLQDEILKRIKMRLRRHTIYLACEAKLAELEAEMSADLNWELLGAENHELLDPKFDFLFAGKELEDIEGPDFEHYMYMAADIIGTLKEARQNKKESL